MVTDTREIYIASTVDDGPNNTLTTLDIFKNKLFQRFSFLFSLFITTIIAVTNKFKSCL